MLATHTVGTGRPLLVLPTASLDGHAMASAIEPAFAGADGALWKRVYADLPGTGSSAAGAPFADSILDSIQETISNLIADVQFGLIGWSYGAYLGSGLLRRWPDRVLGFLSICGGVRIAMEHRDLTGLCEPSREADWLAGVAEQFHESLRHALGRQRREVATSVAELLAKNAPIDNAYFAALHAGGYALSDEDSNQTYAGPVSVLAGRCDRIAGFKDQFALIDRYPLAEYTAMPGVGHFLPLEVPREFAEIFQRWLARL